MKGTGPTEGRADVKKKTFMKSLSGFSGDTSGTGLTPQDDPPMKWGGESMLRPRPRPLIEWRLPMAWGKATGQEVSLAEDNSEERPKGRLLTEQMPLPWRSLGVGYDPFDHAHLAKGTGSYCWNVHKDHEHVMWTLQKRTIPLEKSSLRTRYWVSS